MNTGALGAALVTLLISAQGLAAQQPGQRAPGDSTAHAMMMNKMEQHMRMMDSANVRLDSLVRRMNQATGNAKVSAMAQVINELVAQRRGMQAHMRQMMQTHGPMMRGHRMNRRNNATDTSGDPEHHPEQ